MVRLFSDLEQNVDCNTRAHADMVCLAVNYGAGAHLDLIPAALAVEFFTVSTRNPAFSDAVLMDLCSLLRHRFWFTL
jgi:hypothetical protein